jgi:hypothetical protein
LSLNFASYIYHFSSGILNEEVFPSEDAPDVPDSGMADEETENVSNQLYKALQKMLEVVVAGEGPMIESTVKRKERYLKESNGDVQAAVLKIVNRQHSPPETVKAFLIKAVPLAGIPLDAVRTIWQQLRDSALIAALYGHDLHDERVLSNILLSIISVDTRKAPRLMAQRAFKFTAKRVAVSLVKSGFSGIITKIIPFGFLVDWIFGPERQVTFQAIENFSPDHDSTYFRKYSTWRTWFLSWFSPSWMKSTWKQSSLKVGNWVDWFWRKDRPKPQTTRHEM